MVTNFLYQNLKFYPGFNKNFATKTILLRPNQLNLIAKCIDDQTGQLKEDKALQTINDLEMAHK